MSAPYGISWGIWGWGGWRIHVQDGFLTQPETGIGCWLRAQAVQRTRVLGF